MVQKCMYCKIKKISGLFSFNCKCGLKVLCEKCRYPENHSCPIDYRKEGQQKLEKDNQKVIADKLEKI